MTQKNKNDKKPSVEIADILREHIVDYQQTYFLCPEHYKIVYDMLNCRTAYQLLAFLLFAASQKK